MTALFVLFGLRWLACQAPLRFPRNRRAAFPAVTRTGGRSRWG
jgi:hypothetical protein